MHAPIFLQLGHPSAQLSSMLVPDPPSPPSYPSTPLPPDAKESDVLCKENASLRHQLKAVKVAVANQDSAI